MAGGLQNAVSQDNGASRVFDVRMALRTARLRSFERRVLKLRFEEGLVKAFSAS